MAAIQRIGCGTYLLSMATAVNLWCLAMIALYRYALVPHLLYPPYSGYAVWALAVPVGLLFFPLSRRRLQDLNFPRWFSIVLSLPFTGILILPMLCFLQGARWSNDYGDSPEPSGTLKRIAAVASFLVAMVLVPYVTRLYAPLHFEQS